LRQHTQFFFNTKQIFVADNFFLGCFLTFQKCFVAFLIVVRLVRIFLFRFFLLKKKFREKVGMVALSFEVSQTFFFFDRRFAPQKAVRKIDCKRLKRNNFWKEQIDRLPKLKINLLLNKKMRLNRLNDCGCFIDPVYLLIENGSVYNNDNGLIVRNQFFKIINMKRGNNLWCTGNVRLVTKRLWAQTSY
jgi:hypothetical protein